MRSAGHRGETELNQGESSQSVGCASPRLRPSRCGPRACSRSVRRRPGRPLVDARRTRLGRRPVTRGERRPQLELHIVEVTGSRIRKSLRATKTVPLGTSCGWRRLRAPPVAFRRRALTRQRPTTEGSRERLQSSGLKLGPWPGRSEGRQVAGEGSAGQPAQQAAPGHRLLYLDTSSHIKLLPVHRQVPPFAR